MQNITQDHLFLNETKLNKSFPKAQLNLDDYKIRVRQDRDRNGGNLTEFARMGIICKRINDFEIGFLEYICSELTTWKSRWLCFSIHKPPDPGKLAIFFEEISLSLNKAILTYQILSLWEIST